MSNDEIRMKFTGDTQSLDAALDRFLQKAQAGVTVPINFSMGTGSGPGVTGASSSTLPHQSTSINTGRSYYSVRDAQGRFSNQQVPTYDPGNGGFGPGGPGSSSGPSTTSGGDSGGLYPWVRSGSPDRDLGRAQKEQDDRQHKNILEEQRIQDRAARAYDDQMRRADLSNFRLQASGERSQDQAYAYMQGEAYKEQRRANDYLSKSRLSAYSQSATTYSSLSQLGYDEAGNVTVNRQYSSGFTSMLDPGNMGRPGMGGIGVGIDPNMYLPGSPQAALALRNNFTTGPGARLAKGLYYGLGTSAAQLYNTMTVEAETGVLNPQGHAAFMGQATGSVVGAVIGTSLGGPFGSFIGASVGGQVGQQAMNYAMADPMYRYNTQRSMMAYGMSVGTSASAVALGAESAAFAKKASDDARDNAIRRLHGDPGWFGWLDDAAGFIDPQNAIVGPHSRANDERWARRTGTYVGADLVNAADILKGEAALRAGMLDKGIVPTTTAIDAMKTRYLREGGSAGAEARMTALGKMYSAEGKYRGNVTDVVRDIGAGTYGEAMGDDASDADKATWRARGQGWRDQDYSLRKDASIEQWADARFNIRKSEGTRIGQMGDAYNIRRSAISTRQHDLEVLYASIPDKGSEFAKSTNAKIEQSRADSMSVTSEQSRDWITSHGADATVLGAYHGNWISKLQNYGRNGDFSREASRYSGDIDREMRDIQGDMRRSGLTDVDRKGLDARRIQLVTERQNLIPNAIGQDLSRFMLGQNTMMAEAQFGIASASRFGSNAQVEGAAGNAIKQLNDTIKELTEVLKKPGISADDAARARQGIASALNQRQAEHIQATQTLMSRASNEYSIKMTGDLGKASISGVIGTARDIIRDSNTVQTDYDDREKALRGQIAKGGLTVEQRQGIDKELASLPAARFADKYSAFTRSFDRDDVSGYGYDTMRRSAQRERNQYLPFSPGSSYKLDLEQLRADQGQIRVIDAREATLKSNGMFGPQQRYDLEQKRQSLYTQDAAMLHDLSEGMIDRLPAFSAGRPSGFHSFDSLQLAQMQLSKVGHPSRYFGALNGRDAAFQDSFARSFAVPGTNRPYSRESGVDTLPVLERIARTLDDISRKSNGSQGSGLRMSEAYGRAGANIKANSAPVVNYGGYGSN